MESYIPNRDLEFKSLNPDSLNQLVLPGTRRRVWIITGLMGRNGLCMEIPPLGAKIPLTLWEHERPARMLDGLNMVPAELYNRGDGVAVLNYYRDLPNGDRHMCSFGLFDNRPFPDPA